MNTVKTRRRARSRQVNDAAIHGIHCYAQIVSPRTHGSAQEKCQRALRPETHMNVRISSFHSRFIAPTTRSIQNIHVFIGIIINVCAPICDIFSHFFKLSRRNVFFNKQYRHCRHGFSEKSFIMTITGLDIIIGVLT